MLDIGTHVFINYVLNRHRPSPTGYEKTSVGCYGTVKSIIDDEYYEVSIVSNVTDETLSGCIHKCELIDLGHHEPTYRVGDVVRICDMSEKEKEQYPPGWHSEMNKYIGQTVRIEGHLGRDNRYRLNGNGWTWHASNLEPISEFVGF